MNEFLTCNEIKDLLSPYFDMELPEKEKKIVENHVKNCPECKKELENINKLSNSIKAVYNAESELIADELSSYKGMLTEDIEKCLNVKTNLSAFIDGELDKGKTIECLDHIINCDFCKGQYEKIRQTRELTRNYLASPVYDEFYITRQKTHIKVIEKIRQIAGQRKILSSAAALVFIAVLSWFSFSLFSPVKTDEAYMEKTRFIRSGRPIYVHYHVPSEEFILSELNSEPPEEVISLLYGN